MRNHTILHGKSRIRRARYAGAIRRPLLVWVLLAGIVTGAAGAQGVGVRTEIFDPSAPELRIEDGKLRLSLEDAIAIALERNLSLHVERYMLETSRFGIMQSLGIYDFNSRVDLSSFDETSPAVSALGGADLQLNEGQSWDLGVDRLMPTGGTVSVDWNNQRNETNSRFATVNPSYRVDFDVSFLQPLLRNFGRQTTERGIKIARTNLDISRENFEAQVIAILQLVQDSYWNLVEALQQLVVAEESLELARQLHEQNRIRVEVGTMAPLELVQSEAGVATREEQIIRAQALVGDSEDVLRQLLDLQGMWETTIVPVTDPEMPRLTIDLDESIQTALRERPEIVGKKLSIGNQEIDAQYFGNQKRPRLDLALRYGLNGLGGDVLETDFLTGEVLFAASGDYSDAIDQITSGDFDGWSVALNFAYPVQNRFARAQSAIADVALEQSQAELEELELQVITGVRRLSRLVETAAKVIDSARASRILEERNLDAEQKRYQNGMSTNFLVLEIQEDLTAARSREVSAVTGYRRALTQFYRATGRLIEESGVELAED